MKKLFLFILCAVALMSCGQNVNPDDNITFQQAFSHVSASFTYWLFVGLSILPAAVYIYMYYRGKIEEVDLKVLFAFIALIMIAIFMRPAEVAANTTVEQASRGVFIGY